MDSSYYPLNSTWRWILWSWNAFGSGLYWLVKTISGFGVSSFSTKQSSNLLFSNPSSSFCTNAPSLYQACRKAKEQSCLLLVYIHSPHNPDCDRFVKSCTKSEQWEKYFLSSSDTQNPKYLVWSTLLTSHAGEEAARLLSAYTFPFFAVIQPSSASFPPPILQRIAAWVLLDSTPDYETELLSILEVAYASVQSELYKHKEEQESLKSEQLLRQQQDSAYERSLAIDRTKKQLKEEKEREEKAKKDQEQQIKGQVDCLIKKSMDLWEKIKSDSTTNNLVLSFRWPNGTRTQHSFDQDTATLLGLYGSLYSHLVNNEYPYYPNSSDSTDLMLLSSNFPKISYPIAIDDKKLTELNIQSGTLFYITFAPITHKIHFQP
jgi:hypothetical protein